MYKVAVLGDRESICGFACLGVECKAVHSHKEAKEAFRWLCDNDYGVIYITEYYAELLKDEIDKFKDRVTPAVILIPGLQGNTGEGMNSISKSVERAVGSLML